MHIKKLFDAFLCLPVPFFRQLNRQEMLISSLCTYPLPSRRWNARRENAYKSFRACLKASTMERVEKNREKLAARSHHQKSICEKGKKWTNWSFCYPRGKIVNSSLLAEKNWFFSSRRVHTRFNCISAQKKASGKCDIEAIFGMRRRKAFRRPKRYKNPSEPSLREAKFDFLVGSSQVESAEEGCLRAWDNIVLTSTICKSLQKLCCSNVETIELVEWRRY